MSIVRNTTIVSALALLAGLVTGKDAFASAIASNRNNDVLWVNTAGNVFALRTDGTNRSKSTSTLIETLGANSRITGTGDLDGDGYGDIVERNTANGNVTATLRRGLQLVSSGTIWSGVDLGWQIVGVVDFDGNGKADLLWRNPTNQGVIIWFMNGLTVSSMVSLPNVDSNWSVSAVGDFNGDNRGDIMWRGTNGDVFEWEMNGSSITGSGTVYSGVDTNWAIWGSGDFDGDGRSDLAWYNPFANGALVWLMNGLTVKQIGGSYPTTGLEPISVSDFNNDGKAEMMLRNTDSSSNLNTWFFSGVTRTSTAIPWTSFGIGFTSRGAFTDLTPL